MFFTILQNILEVEKLITDTLPLEKVEWAMQQHIEGKAIKFLIKP